MKFIKVLAMSRSEAESVVEIARAEKDKKLPKEALRKTINTANIAYYEEMLCLSGNLDDEHLTKTVDVHLNSGESLLLLMPIQEFEALLLEEK